MVGIANGTSPLFALRLFTSRSHSGGPLSDQLETADWFHQTHSGIIYFPGIAPNMEHST